MHVKENVAKRVYKKHKQCNKKMYFVRRHFGSGSRPTARFSAHGIPMFTYDTTYAVNLQFSLDALFFFSFHGYHFCSLDDTTGKPTRCYAWTSLWYNFAMFFFRLSYFLIKKCA